MRFLKDPETQVVTRRLSQDVVTRFEAQVEEFNNILDRLRSDGSDYAIEQVRTAERVAEDALQHVRKAVSEGVRVSALNPKVVEDIEALDHALTNIAEFAQRVTEGEFDESELAEYAE